MSNYDSYGWEDHLTQASSLAKMVGLAGESLEQLRDQAAFMGVASSIEQHIYAAIDKVTDEINKRRG